MKTTVKFIGIFSIIISSCTSLKNISFYEDTDSYVNIKQERRKKAEMLAKQKQQEEERQKYIQDSIAKEQEKINNNPYYKEPNYSKDDYYDYEYAARIKRFYNPVCGLGYYDNWYTNYGFYGTPYYGSSIYMNYGNYYPYSTYGNYWGNPYFSPYYSIGYGYSPYSYGYSPYYGYGYYPYGYGYSPYSYGYSPYYGYGYYPYNYYNAYDINSGTYAPRGSHEGFNSARTVNNITREENNFSKNSVSVSPEMNIPKFDETARPKVVTKIEPRQINAINAPLIHQINTNPNLQPAIIPRTAINNLNIGNTTINIPKGNAINNTGNPGRPNNNGMGKPVPVEVSPKENNNFNNNSNFMQRNIGNGFGNNGGGGSFTPRGSGSGGNGVGRPR